MAVETLPLPCDLCSVFLHAAVLMQKAKNQKNANVTERDI